MSRGEGDENLPPFTTVASVLSGKNRTRPTSAKSLSTPAKRRRDIDKFFDATRDLQRARRQMEALWEPAIDEASSKVFRALPELSLISTRELDSCYNDQGGYEVYGINEIFDLNFSFSNGDYINGEELETYLAEQGIEQKQRERLMRDLGKLLEIFDTRSGDDLAELSGDDLTISIVRRV